MISAIDHPVIAVGDMEAARATYERLGFTVAPRGAHLEWGTGNWCIMFEHDYLELRGIVDHDKYTHHLQEHMAEFGEGLMGVAFATADAEASYLELAQRGMHPQPVRQLSRRFEIPDAPVEPRFSLCFLPPEETPGLMSVVLCQHLTPELLRRPEWLRHENGACGVASLTGVVSDLAMAEAALRPMFDERQINRDGDALSISFQRDQTITLTTTAQLAARHAGLHVDVLDNRPRLMAATLRTENLATTAACFSSRAVSHELVDDGRLRIDPSYTCGVALEFTPT